MSDYSLSIFGVQPLVFGTAELNIALSQSMEPWAQSGNDLPGWVAEMEHYHPNNHFRFQALENDRPLAFEGMDYSLSAWLCSNTVLNQHIVLFEMKVDTDIRPEEVDENSIRSMLTATRKDKRAEEVISIIHKACKQLADANSCQVNDVEVLQDTCNITLFFKARGDANIDVETLELELSHGSAERIRIRRTQVHVSDETVLYFGGRVHIVVSSGDDEVYVLKQIMFMLQVMWFYVPICLRHAAQLHQKMLDDPSQRNLDYLEGRAAQLVYAYHAVRLQNESSKFSYESMYSQVYQQIESRWVVENSIDQLQRYTRFFRTFITDMRANQSRKADETLNYVLAGLAFLGIVGLWSNILAAQIYAKKIRSFGELLSISTNSALGFTIIIFLSVSLGAAAWLILYSIRMRRRGG